MTRQYLHYWISLLTDGVVLGDSNGLPFLFTESQANRIIHAATKYSLRYFDGQRAVEEFELLPVHMTKKEYLRKYIDSCSKSYTYSYGPEYKVITQNHVDYPSSSIRTHLHEFQTLMAHVSSYSYSIGYVNYKYPEYNSYDHKYATPNYVYQLLHWEEFQLA